MKIIRGKQVFCVLSLLFLSLPSVAFSQGPTQKITIAVLESRWFDMGQFHVQWNGKDEYGNQLSTGVYIYSLESAEFRQAKKLILLK